jgi:hypothetical protein
MFDLADAFTGLLAYIFGSVSVWWLWVRPLRREVSALRSTNSASLPCPNHDDPRSVCSIGCGIIGKVWVCSERPCIVARQA